MPQLDFFSISNQFFWGIFYFVLFYAIMELYVVPTLFTSIFAREYFIKNTSTDSNDNLYYVFTAFFIFNQLLNDYNQILTQTLLDLKDLDFNFYVTLYEFVDFEINNFEYSVYFFEELDNK